MSLGEIGRPAPAAVIHNPLALRKLWVRIDHNEQALQWAQTGPGQALLHAAFFLLLAATPLLRLKHLCLVVAALALCAIVPTRRLAILCAMGTLFVVLRPFRFETAYTHFSEIWTGVAGALPMQIGMSMAAIVFLAGLVMFASGQRSGRLGIAGQRPVLTMSVLCAALTAITVLVPASSAISAAAWTLLAILSGTFFFVAYALLDNRRRDPIPLLHLPGFVRPIWATGVVPIKGPGFLKKYEASDAAELARTRLKAVKLLCWAVLLYWTWELCFNQVIYGYLQFPRMEDAIADGAAGQRHVLAIRWLILAVYFMAEVMIFAAEIHLLVAIVRMAGFHVPRGMVNPLASRTLTEFWGRYFFYFKEMLADIFFFPAFQRYFKKSPRLRIAFATFAAAFVGNILFDFVPRLPEMSLYGVSTIVEHFYSYTIYAALLTTGLIASVLSTSRPDPEQGWFAYHVAPRIRVIGFFMLLQIFADSTGSLPVGERIMFFLSLFGIVLG